MSLFSGAMQALSAAEQARRQQELCERAMRHYQFEYECSQVFNRRGGMCVILGRVVWAAKWLVIDDVGPVGADIWRL